MSIVNNKKVFHDYFIEETIEAGIVLEGWEAKGIRAGKAQIRDAHAFIKNGEVFLIGMSIVPLETASTHINPDPVRTRKLLLHKEQISKLIGKVEVAGKTLVVIDLHFTKGRIKISLGLATGKKLYDKRNAIKERDSKLETAQLMKVQNR